MIAGPVFQAGPKEEAPTAQAPPRRAGFDRFLKTAAVAGFSPQQPARKPLPARSREAYGRERSAPAPKEKPVKRDAATPQAATEANAAQAAAISTPTAQPAADSDPVRTFTAPQPTNPLEEAENPELPSTALTPTGEPQTLGKAATGATQFAQIGLAAYRLSPHGVGEATHAEAMGLLPPGSAAPEGMPLAEAAQQVTNAALLQARTLQEAQQEAETNGPLNAVEALNLSRKPSSKEMQAQLAEMEQVTAENPQTRQHALQRPATPGAEPPPLPFHQRNLGLEAQLHADLKQGGERGGQTTAFQNAETGAVLAAPGGAAAAGSAAQAGAHLASHTPGSTAEQMIDRIADQARWLIRNDRNEVTMRLHPEELGEMKLKVVRSGREWTVDMTVDTHAAKKLIETNLDALHTRLQGETAQNGQFSFNVDVRQGNDPQRSQAFGPAPGRENLLGGVERANNADAVLTRQRPLWGRSGVGIYI